jgi:RHS repeat-associated protein
MIVALLLVASASGLQKVDPSLSAEGETATLLPDGRWLLIGGRGPDGQSAAARIWDPRSREAVALPQGLQYPRAGHTATLLPNGTIAVIGGIDPDGHPLNSVEIFDPTALVFRAVPADDLAARASHTATLLTDGRVLLAGGVSTAGAVLSDLQLWDPGTRAAVTVPAELQTARRSHAAMLRADGGVLLSSGVDQRGRPVDEAEVFDPEFQSIVRAFDSESSAGSPSMAATVPIDGSTAIDLNARIVVRFSTFMKVETLNARTVTLSGPAGAIAVSVVPAEEGRLLFVTPKQPLAPGTTYNVALEGAADTARQRLPYTTFGFTTLDEPNADEPLPDDEEWVPEVGRPEREWKSGRPDSPWRSLAPLQARPGVTAVSGQVLRLNGLPLKGVTLRVGSKTASTDESGRFLLIDVPSGRHELVIDGHTANRPRVQYGVFEVGVDVAEGITKVLPYTVWMPKIDTAHAVTIPSPTTFETVVTTPRIPGLELRIPPRSIIRDANGRVVTQVSITPIPVDRPPFPLPPGVSVPIYFTIQPGGAYVEVDGSRWPEGARLVYPNYSNAAPGHRMDFWQYDPEERGWYVYGQGSVTANRKQIVPDSGVAIYEFTGAMVGNPSLAPGEGPGHVRDGDPVDLFTGLLVVEKTDLALPDVIPIALTRTYRPRDARSRGFGIGAAQAYDIFLVGTVFPYTYIDLVLADGARIHYDRISPGTSYFDAIYEHTSTPTAFYKSRITWEGKGYELRLRDGTLYSFREGFAATRPQQSGLLSIRDRNGNTLAITRDAHANIVKVTSPNNRWIELSYDSSHRATQARDNIGRTVTYAYDALGRLTRVTDPAGGVTEYTYDAAHRMLSIKDARGIVFLRNEYDTSGRVIRQTQADGTTYQFTYRLNEANRVTQTEVIDPRGTVRRVTFNASGYALTDTAAAGAPEQQTMTYDVQAGTNFVLSAIDELGRRTAYTYDSAGNVTSITRLAGTADAVRSSFQYEPQYGRLVSVTDPLNHTTSFQYDDKGNLTSFINALGHRTVLTYNLAGLPTSVVDPAGSTSRFDYDAGDLVAITSPLGHTTTQFVDSAGRLRSVTNALGYVTLYEYDSLNRLTRIVDAKGGVTAMTYDANGNLLSVTDPRGGVTRYVYDSMDRLSSRTDPLGASETYIYDTGGNATTFTDRRGTVTTFRHDRLNRRIFAGFGTTVNGESPSYESSITYSYDAGNRLRQLVDSTSDTITLVPDGLDRLLSETTPQGAVSYTYDRAGRRETMTVAGQPVVSYAHDDADRLIGIRQGASTVLFAYDAADRRTSLTLPNGVVTEYAYDAASQLTALTYTSSAGVLGNLTYAYDAVGNRTHVGGTWARTGLPQPVASAVYNEANQLMRWGSSVLTYDANGNLITDGTATYTWNARNQLATIAGRQTASFQYDPLGRRIGEIVGGVATRYLHDGLNPVQELSGITPTANLLAGLTVSEYFVRRDTNGISTMVADGLRSTVALLDAAGAMQTEYLYEPSGLTTVSGIPSGNRVQFAGWENDGTGLYYYRARYYAPVPHRFLSEDPDRYAFGGAYMYRHPVTNALRFMAPLDRLTLPLPPGGGATSLVNPPPEWFVQPGAPTRFGESDDDSPRLVQEDPCEVLERKIGGLSRDFWVSGTLLAPLNGRKGSAARAPRDRASILKDLLDTHDEYRRRGCVWPGAGKPFPDPGSHLGRLVG